MLPRPVVPEAARDQIRAYDLLASAVARPRSYAYYLGATFATLLTAARKLGENAFAQICSIAGPSPLRAVGLA